MRADAVIVAAGQASRFGGGDKLFAALCGKPVLEWTLDAFLRAQNIDRMVVVVASATLEPTRDLPLVQREPRIHVVTGGPRRRDSVQAGLQASRARYVAIHDGARPLVTPELIDRCLAAADGCPGAIAAIPATDTIKEVEGGLVVGHPQRERLWAAQTPQVVLRQAWLHAASASDQDETDDAAMLARVGLEVVVVEGDPANLKITRPQDLAIAEALLRERRQCG